MKFFKRVIAVGAAMVMAMSMMSMGASADNWNLYYNPTGTYKTYDYKNFSVATGTISYFYDSCDSFYQTPNATTGEITYVYYRAACINSSGNVSYNCCGNYYYYEQYAPYSSHKVNLTSTVPANKIMRVSHNIHNNYNSSSMYGTVSLH